jgi:hypothetical protein
VNVYSKLEELRNNGFLQRLAFLTVDSSQLPPEQHARLLKAFSDLHVHYEEKP